MTSTRIRRWIRGDDTGANAVEYGLIIAGIAAIIAVAVFAVGAVTKGQFTSTCDAWRSAAADNSICR
jgi:pilus assembly protein Flp/PilA